MEVGAEHGDNYIEVYLEFVRDAFFDAEEMGFMAGIPAAELSPGEEGGDYDKSEGGEAARGAATGVGWFSFGWKVEMLAGRF